MHPAQSALSFVERDAALNEAWVEAVIFELPLAPGPREESSLVLVSLRFNEPGDVKVRRKKLHGLRQL